MDSKHYLTLVAIGLTTLVFAIGAASYAYFASSVDVNKSVPVGATTAAQTAAFITDTTGEINIDVSADLMQQWNADDENTIAELTDTGELKVFLSAAEDKKVSTCTYNIIYEWYPESTKYVRTANVQKEFTITAKVKEVLNIPTLTVDDPNYKLFKMNSPELEEINIDELDWLERNETVGVGDDATTKVMRYANIVEGATISSLNKDVPTTVVYEFIVKFYNANKDQSIQRSKNFAGEIRVDSKSINC